MRPRRKGLITLRRIIICRCRPPVTQRMLTFTPDVQPRVHLLHIWLHLILPWFILVRLCPPHQLSALLPLSLSSRYPQLAHDTQRALQIMISSSSWL